MTSRSSLFFLAILFVGGTVVCCSSSSDAGSDRKEDFCSLASRCSSATCGSFAADCSKVTALLNPTLLAPATACAKTSDCSGAGPLACLGSSLADVKPSAAQEKLAEDYCASCSVASGSTCTAAFFETLGKVLLPFGDAPVSAIDDACTSSPLGKTACQGAFTTCAEAQLAKSLATSIPTDTATCLVDAIKAGATASGEGGAPDASREAAADADASACTDLVNQGSFVVLERVAGSEPAALGGEIADGTYTLLSLRAYAGAPAGGLTLKRTIRLTGSKLESITEVADPPEVDAYSGAFVATGTTFSRSFTCPETPSDSAAYSTDGTALTLIFPDHTVYTYGRR